MPSRSNRASVRRRLFMCHPLHYHPDVHFTASPASDLILQRARTVEETVCKDCKGTTPAYKSKIRTLFVNLKDKNNPGLRRSVTAGDIPAQTFARMTSQVRLLARKTNFGKKDVAETFERDVYHTHRIWPLRNAKRLMRRLRKTICSCRSARPTSRQKQTPSSVAGASR